MESQYSNLFTPVKVGNTVLRNRIISPPSMPHYHQGPEKYPTDPIITHFANRAKGGAAVVTCSGTKTYPKTPITAHFQSCDIYDPQSQNYLSMMADAVHFYGAKCSIILDSPNRPGYDVTGGIDPFITAGEGEKVKKVKNKELTYEMFEGIIDEYANQCVVFQDCGFDMVFLHMSYVQFIPARFLSPLTNHRADEFGGSLENRAKFPIMVFDRIKERCGKDFILHVSMSAVEPEGGLTLEESTKFVELAAGHFDIVEIRHKTIDSSQPVNYVLEPEPFRSLAREFKDRVKDTGVFVDAVGGYHDFAVADEMIKNGETDFIGMARPFIADSEIVNKAREGRSDDIVPCIRCNKCHVPSTTGPYLSICSVNPVLGYEHKIKRMIDEPKTKKRVAIVGGGPGGMKAAMVCAERGHAVTIYEKNGRLGGMLNISDYCDFKWTIKKLRDFLIYQVNRKGVEVKHNTHATRELLEREGYDEVIVSVGSHPIIPKSIPGADKPNVIPAAEVYGVENTLAKNIIVVGGGDVGAETALHLAKVGHKVTVIEMRNALAAELTPIHYRAVFEEEWEKEPNFNYILNAKCTGILDDGITFVGEDGKEQTVVAGCIVMAAGMAPNNKEAMALFSSKYHTRLVGDCDNSGGNVQRVLRSALGAACQV